MKKLLLIPILLLGLTWNAEAQKYFTRAGKVTFQSKALLEKIEAQNNKATSVIDVETGQLEFAVLIKAFQFEKALMQEHFNENYMESSQFPKAKFKGEILDVQQIDFTKDGEYLTKIEGTLTIHGVSQNLQTTAQITIANGQVSAQSEFSVAVADFNIKIPSVVQDNIAKEVTVSVDIENYKLFKK